MARKKRVKQIIKADAIKRLRRISTELENLQVLIGTSRWGYDLLFYSIIKELEDVIEWIPLMEKAKERKKFEKLSPRQRREKLREMVRLKIKRAKQSK